MASSSIPTTMKAAQIKETGGVEVVNVVDVPVPTLGSGEALVKVEWAGVNYIDNYFRSGLYKTALPTTLGNEFSGRVVQISEDVDQSSLHFKIGDNVASNRSLAGYAEYATAKVHNQIAKLPEGVSTKEGATALLQGLTAVTLVEEAHKVQKGQFVLIHAIAGGMGLLLCSHLGATVFGTTSSAEKAELAKKHGAHHVFLYTEEPYSDITKKIKAITGGEGVDAGVHVVFDGVGKDTFEENFEVLRRKGSFISFGNASGAAPPVVPARLALKNLKFARPTVTWYVHTREEYQYYADKVFKYIKDGVIKLNVHKEYPFTTEGIRATQTDITGRGTTGKLIVKIAQ
ncbi:GroES-like protein [Atractiella rhizophila]|nr:GroES-like protein [Atractiella rhizophila]